MSLSDALRGAPMALLLATACILAPAALAKTTDYSDLWWISTESGWGIQLVQQNNTIFATMFVYGPDGQPAWYSATLFYRGTNTFTWSGTLYKTTGPWFGTDDRGHVHPAADPGGGRWRGISARKATVCDQWLEFDASTR